jgi:putative ABC transport system substrate-binding protein
VLGFDTQAEEAILKRREFITLLGGAAAWPLMARAQQPAMPVIGFLHLLSSDSIPDLVSAFRKGLGETGYVEGRNVAIEYHWADNATKRLPELAADLVRRGVAVIVTPGNRPAALAAKAATPKIPIVFGMGGDPIEAGLVASLNRPGGNATGFVELNNETASKRVGVLHDLIPGASRFALLLDPNSLGMSVMPDLQAGASAIGLQVESLIAAGTDRGVEAAFATLAQKRINGLLVNPSASFFALRPQFAALAVRHAVPVIYWDSAFVQAGGLMSYGSSVADMSRQVGIYAGRILKGEKPADMPVMRATKFELVVNLKAAKAIGLTIPEAFLLRADEVIE